MFFFFFFRGLLDEGLVGFFDVETVGSYVALEGI